MCNTKYIKKRICPVVVFGSIKKPNDDTKHLPRTTTTKICKW
jgi:hypothetical protein